MTTADNKKDGRRVLLWFLGFFLVFCSVNIFFVMTALKTHTGVVVDNPYERGLNYNQLLNEAKKHEANPTGQ